jgi:hypothetical protein
MQERGVSRIVSMKFEDYEAGKLPPSPGAPPAVQPPPAAAAPPPAPETTPARDAEPETGSPA